MEATTAPSLPRLNEPAPDFKAVKHQVIRTSGTSSDRENYFGAVQANGSTAKGALSRKVSALLAEYP